MIYQYHKYNYYEEEALYEKGFDATIAVEHETNNHNAWEYFANGYVKWSEDANAGHVTKDSFWNNYRTWGLGIAYKPCVVRSRNQYGCLRIGASGGSDTYEFVGWTNVGYEHNYVLRHGYQLYWQLKTDVCINGLDLFRTTNIYSAQWLPQCSSPLVTSMNWKISRGIPGSRAWSIAPMEKLPISTSAWPMATPLRPSSSI